MMIPADYEWSKMSGPNRRWHRIAADLDRAIAAARLTGPERLILQYVREKTWGSRRLQDDEIVPCAVHATYLAKHWGLCRQNISTALSALTEDRLLVKVGRGYLIGKHVGKWAEGRISPTLMRYAAYGDTIAPEDDARSEESNSIPMESRDIQKESKSIPRKESKSIPGGMRIDSSTESNPIRPHIRNAGASEDFQKREEEKTDGQASGLKIRAQDDWGLDDDDDLSGEIVAPLDSVPAALVTDGPPGDPEPSPAPAVSAEEGDIEEFRDWVRGLILKATGDDFQAEIGWKVAPHWLQMGHRRSVVAGHVFEACGALYHQKGIRDLPGWIGGTLKKRQPDWAVPPCPDRWKDTPSPAQQSGPVIFRASAEARERQKRREAVQIAKRQREAEEREAEGRERIAALMATGELQMAGGAR